MPPDSHLWIPQDRIRSEPVPVHGGGDTYTRDDVEAHSRRLRDAFERSSALFANTQDADVAADLIVQITTATGRSVAKERQHLKNLGFQIVSLSPSDPHVAIARIEQDRIPGFRRRLERYAGTPRHVGKGNLGAIEGIAPVATERKVDPVLAEAAREQAVSCMVSVYASLSDELKNRVATRVAGELRNEGKDDVAVRAYSNGAVAVTAKLTATEMNRLAEQFTFVSSIDPNGEIVSESAIPADPLPPVLDIGDLQCQTPVAIVDSGVNANCSLLAGLVRQTIVELPPGSVGAHFAHGTFVASRAVYGDDLTTVILTRRARPWCPVIDVQVTGTDAIGNRVSHRSDALMAVLERVIPAVIGHTRVVNISLGGEPITEGRYSPFARLLDHLARRHGVLFVVSAGNINNPSAAPPNHYLNANARIAVPSESLLSLTVGSIARFVENGSVAREREIAPYSRRGPGADDATKPELAAHGGNVAFNGLTWTTSPRIAAYGIGGSGTHLEYATGTSFSAPLVAQYAARLFDAYPDAHPNLVRALLCHFAEPILTPSPAGLAPRDFCGFGEPIIERALYATAHSTAYLFQGSIGANMYMHIPFHVPDVMARTPTSRLVIRGTVVFDPPVSPDDSVDYSLCRISGKLLKRVPNGLSDVAIGGAEDDVRYPWNPLIHFAHNFRHGYAGGDWELKLRLMTRGDLPGDFVQQVAVVVEVIDASNGLNVRDAILREVQAYSPIVLRLAA